MKLAQHCLAFLVWIGLVLPVLSQLLFCYYTNWSQYRRGSGKFIPNNIDPSLCTHILFAFATLNGNQVKTTEWNDVAMLNEIVRLKKRNPQLKILLSVGGWGTNARKFSSMASTARSREEFLNSASKFLNRYSLDGLDIDWEYPAVAYRGGSPKDKYNFVLLLQLLRRRLTRRYLLTIAVAAGKQIIDVGYDVQRIARTVDYILLMTYDFHGSWEKLTGHLSPLYPKKGETNGRQYLNVDYAVTYWKSKGAPANKLIMGIPFYGRSFTLVDGQLNGMMAPATRPGTPGPIIHSSGVMSYQEICLVEKSWSRHWDNDHQVPYLVRGNQWVGYENKESVRLKGNYLVSRNLAGAMIWSLDFDDFDNACRQGRFPLLNTLVSSLALHNRRPTTFRSYTVRPQATTPRIWTHSPNIPHSICPPNVNVIIGDPYNCHVFHVCYLGRDYRYICPPTLVWDPRIQACNYNHH
ncbi:chitinase-3-like protein 1 isoform X2 [Octopus bimaculoides]|nr:chitinase-3-like protein 1 isoform X2 [Octopus bimaculoides]XP_052831177.1 chitinase-3-like protein 1 isoform X2 [Octopus bimaculoides]